MTLVQFLDLLGVGVFAVSGALAAVRKRLDLLGVVVIAMVTAIGGGTTRDLLLDRAVFWSTQPSYLYVIVASALLTVVWTRRFRPPDRALAIADALGLALFAISGAQIAERVGLPGIVCVIMGTITGVAGGMIRDVLTAEIPMVIRRGQIYATAAIAGIVAYLVLSRTLELAEPIAAVAGMAMIAGLRISAIAWDWTLPVFSLEEAGKRSRRPSGSTDSAPLSGDRQRQRTMTARNRRKPDPHRSMEKPEERPDDRRTEWPGPRQFPQHPDPVDDTLDDSFPASDPPSWWSR